MAEQAPPLPPRPTRHYRYELSRCGFYYEGVVYKVNNNPPLQEILDSDFEFQTWKKLPGKVTRFEPDGKGALFKHDTN